MLVIKKKLSTRKAVCKCSRCESEYECNDIYTAKKSRVGDLCNTCKNIIKDMEILTPEGLKEVFHYDQKTGKLIHKLHTLRCKKGEEATYPHSGGYLNVSVGGKEYLAHRVIWFMQTGNWVNQIDHINHNRSDNRWENLRQVINRENSLNTSLSKNNSSGINGVRILPSGRFCAFIMVNRKQISLGTFDLMEDAKKAREAANKKYNFHVNHGKEG